MSNNSRPNRAALLLATSIILSACAQLLMKAGMIELNTAGINDDMAIIDVILHNRVALLLALAGVGCYAVSMLSWLLALVSYPLSFAYPLLGLSYVLVYLGAIFWQRIGEEASLLRSAGIILVIAGVALVTYKKADS